MGLDPNQLLSLISKVDKVDVIWGTAKMTSTLSHKAFAFGTMNTSMRHSQQCLWEQLRISGDPHKTDDYMGRLY